VEPPVLTGISAKFTESADNPGQIAIELHILLESDDAVVYDMEIYFNKQEKPWQAVEPIQAPPGWNPGALEETAPTGGTRIVGIRYVTEQNPLRTCQPVQFVIQVIPPDALGNFITIYLTDKDHKVIGQVAAQRVAAEPKGVGGSRNGLIRWLPGALAAPCQPTG